MEELIASETTWFQKRPVQILEILERYFTILALICLDLFFIPLGIVCALQEDVFLWQATYNLLLALIFTLLGFYVLKFPHHTISSVFTIGMCVELTMGLIWEVYIRDSRVFPAWSFFGNVQVILGILSLIGAVISIIKFFTFIFARLYINYQINQKRIQKTEKLNWFQFFNGRFHYYWQREKRLQVVWFVLIIISTFTLLGMTQRVVFPNRTITLYPGDREIQFGGYGDMEPTRYSPEVRQSMNDHKFMMIVHSGYWLNYDLWKQHRTDWLSIVETSPDYISQRAAFINGCRYWKTNYPQIPLMILIHGMPCGMSTDYSVTNTSYGVGGTIWLMKQVFETAVEYNLTNVIGVHTDQEECAEDWWGGGVEHDRNATRNSQATAAYLDLVSWLSTQSKTTNWTTFFGFTNQFFGIDHFMLTTTYGAGSMVDYMDDDFDLDVFSTNNVAPIIPYDEWLPMLYNDNSKSADDAHYTLYVQLTVLQRGLMQYGYQDRMGALLGCVNEKVFNTIATTPQWNGNGFDIVTGGDVLARQAKIVKAFNCSRVWFFPMQNCCGFTGPFDAYGSKFLDSLNNTCNSAEAQQPFTILFRPSENMMTRDIARDYFLSAQYHFAEIYSEALWLHYYY